MYGETFYAATRHNTKPFNHELPHLVCIFLFPDSTFRLLSE